MSIFDTNQPKRETPLIVCPVPYVTGAYMLMDNEGNQITIEQVMHLFVDALRKKPTGYQSLDKDMQERELTERIESCLRVGIANPVLGLHQIAESIVKLVQRGI